MPFKSEKQRRYIYAAASQGEAWARKFIKDEGHTPPKRSKKSKPPWERKRPKVRRKALTKVQKAEARARAKRAGRPYPNLVDNMAAGR